VQYADELVLLAKEETVLNGAIDNLNDIGICYGMEIYMEINEVIRISRKPSPVQIITDQKQLANVDHFEYLGSMITNDARCTRKIEIQDCHVKAAFNKKQTLFTNKLDLNLRKKLVNFCAWSIALYSDTSANEDNSFQNHIR
jgi:hypothetical protein